jgi:hypothetical protein
LVTIEVIPVANKDRHFLSWIEFIKLVFFCPWNFIPQSFMEII